MPQPPVAPYDRPEPMDPLDHLRHRGEASPRLRSGVVTVEILDRVPDWDALRTAVERTTRSVPRLRQKVVAPMLPTTAPRWVGDAHFDLDYHLRRVSLPEPGDLRELLDLAELIAQFTFDPGRPLWTMTLVDGFEGDRAALVLHNSHAVTDGAIGMLVLHELYDDERDAEPRDMPPVPRSGDLTASDLTREGLGEIPGNAWESTKSLAGGALGVLSRLSRDPFVVLTSTQKYVESMRRVARRSGIPSSPAFKRRGPRSRSSAVDFDLNEFRAAANRANASLNDAYIAAICGAARIYHEAVRRPVQALSIAVPVNMRTVTDPSAHSYGSGIIIAAPVTPDTGERILAIHRLLAAGRIEPVLDVIDSVAPMLTPLPDPMIEAVTGLRPTVDVRVRNVRGYRAEKYLGGARVERAYTLCPRTRVAVMAAFTIREERGTVTTRVDTDAVQHPDVWDQALAQGVAEIEAYGRNDAAADAETEAVVAPVVQKPRARRTRRPSASGSHAVPTAQASDVPGDAGDLPGETGDVPSDVGDLPSHAGDLPAEATTDAAEATAGADAPADLTPEADPTPADETLATAEDDAPATSAVGEVAPEVDEATAPADGTTSDEATPTAPPARPRAKRAPRTPRGRPPRPRDAGTS